MTNEEAFNEALKNVTSKTWFPKKWAFNEPIRVVWYETRIAQAVHYWIITGQLETKEIPKTLKELKKIEKEMEKFKKEN